MLLESSSSPLLASAYYQQAVLAQRRREFQASVAFANSLVAITHPYDPLYLRALGVQFYAGQDPLGVISDINDILSFYCASTSFYLPWIIFSVGMLALPQDAELGMEYINRALSLCKEVLGESHPTLARMDLEVADVGPIERSLVDSAVAGVLRGGQQLLRGRGESAAGRRSAHRVGDSDAAREVSDVLGRLREGRAVRVRRRAAPRGGGRGDGGPAAGPRRVRVDPAELRPRRRLSSLFGGGDRSADGEGRHGARSHPRAHAGGAVGGQPERGGAADAASRREEGDAS